jgi:hypothetical protein
VSIFANLAVYLPQGGIDIFSASYIEAHSYVAKVAKIGQKFRFLVLFTHPIILLM